MPEEHRIEGVKVVSFGGEDRGTFDATHIVGSEVIRGVDTEAAVDRAFRARNIVELASPGVVSTDSIRYVLDGLRHVKPGTHLSDQELRQFKEHVQTTVKTATRRGAPGPAPKEERRKIDLREGEGAPPRKGGVVLVDVKPDLRTRTRRDCQYRIISRNTVHQPYVRVSPLSYEHSSEMFHTQQTDRMVQELKVVLEQKLSNEITYGEFGASASLTGTALEQFLREYVQTHTFVLVHYTVRVSGSLTITVHSTVSETWAWDGTDCPADIGPPETLKHVLVGPPVNYDFNYQYETWEMKAQQSWLGGETWAQSQARQHVVSLINTGAWMPTDLPLSADLPTPTNF